MGGNVPKAACILFGYLLGSGLLLRLILAQHPPVFLVWFSFLAWIIIGIVVMGIALAVYENRTIEEGVKQGVELLKLWVAYIVGMVLISGLWCLLSYIRVIPN